MYFDMPTSAKRAAFTAETAEAVFAVNAPHARVIQDPTPQIPASWTGGVQRESYTIKIPVYKNRDDGVVMFENFPGTLAERITIRPLDILLSIDGKQITSECEARQVIETARGRDVELVVLRHMANRNLDVADGWTVSSPTSPLFQDRTHIVWRQLSRQVTYPVIAE